MKTTMMKMFFVGLVALAGAAGCDSNNNNNNSPDLSMNQMNNPDMAETCFSGTPMTNEQFLNACTTASSVEISPEFPSAAPNGVLPPLN
jgi:hypothetical protein